MMKRILLTLLLVLALARPAAAQIAHVATATGGHSTVDGGAGVNATLDCGSGSNRLLTMVVLGTDINGVITSISGTYNGVSVTQQAAASLSSEMFVWIGTLVAPATGSNTANVIVTSGGYDGGWTYFVSCFTGVDQVTPVDAAWQVANGSSTAPAVSITTATANAWIIGGITTQDPPTTTVGNGVTIPTNGGPISHVFSFQSTMGYRGPEASPGAVSFAFTLGVSSRWKTGAIALKPAAAGGATTPRLMLLGVGGHTAAATMPFPGMGFMAFGLLKRKRNLSLPQGE